MEKENGETAMRHPRHFACNSYSDAQVGRVIDAAAEAVPDALVMYTSDHGDMFGSHRLHGKGPCVYDEIARIPFIVSWPGRAPAGKVSAGPVSHIDVVPTLLEFFAQPVPDLLQGTSLLEQLRHPARRVNDAIFIDNRFELDHDGFGAFAPIRCVFDGRYKLAINLLDTDELYDLADDPGEMKNLIHDPAAVAVRDELQAKLVAWMNRTRDPLRGAALVTPGMERRGRGVDLGRPYAPATIRRIVVPEISPLRYRGGD